MGRPAAERVRLTAQIDSAGLVRSDRACALLTKPEVKG